MKSEKRPTTRIVTELEELAEGVSHLLQQGRAVGDKEGEAPDGGAADLEEGNDRANFFR